MISTVTLAVQLRALQSTRLPGWMGSTLHGALGHALEAVSPAARGYLVDPVPRDAAIPKHLAAMSPTRLALVPPSPEHSTRELAAGELFSFGVVLLADGVDAIEPLCSALVLAASRGLGRHHARFEVCSIADTSGVLWADGSMRKTAVEDAPSRLEGTSTVRLSTLTPLHIMRAGKVVKPSFLDLVTAAYRRVACVEAFLGEGDPGYDLRELAEPASSVTIESEQLVAWRSTRWSSRQHQKHPMRGVVGDVVYSGEVRPFLSVLADAARLGLGKGPSLGLGRVELQAS